MAFVDGTNFIAQLAKELEIIIRPNKRLPESFELARCLINKVLSRESIVIRRYWFGSYTGSEEVYHKICAQLRENEFEPVMFNRRNGREKGVDIALTKEVLVNAFNQNFDTGLLVAGDEDYVGLVQETKRYGQRMVGAFFKTGLSAHLRLAVDEFRYLGLVNQDAQIEKILDRIREQCDPIDARGGRKHGDQKTR